MKRMLTIGTVFALFLTVFVSGVVVAPTLGKVTNTVPGGNIQYFSGGSISFTVPSSVTNFPITDQFIMRFADFVDSTYGPTDSITLFLKIPTPTGGQALAPLSVITTSQAGADFAKLAWFKTPVYRPPLLDNVKVVSSDVLQVERHGNSIIVNFNPSTPLSLYMPISPSSTTLKLLSLPAFNIELSKYGGSVHTSTVETTLVPYSGYTLEQDISGFDANGALTCSAWNLNNAATTSAFIVMHGIETWTPP